MPSDLPPGAVPPDSSQHWGPAPSAGSYPSLHMPPTPSMASGRPARWPALTALAIALIALAVGVAAWFRSTPHNNQPPPKPAYTDQQVVNAKTNVCAAFEKVDHSLALAYARNGGSDPTAQLAVATSTQLTLDAGSRYLSVTLADEPATPADLATAVRKQTDAYQKALIGFLNGLTVSDPSQQPNVHASDEATTTIRQMCK